MSEMYLRIADFNISVEEENINHSFIENYLPFRIRKEETASVLFTVRFGELPPPQGRLAQAYEVDGLKLLIYLNATVECDIVARFENKDKEYRFTASKQWTDIQMNMTFNEKEDYIVLDCFMMLAFVYSSSFHDTVLVHASSICCENRGVAFLGHSGVGKSTHSRLWVEYIEGSELLNDDQPAIRIIDGICYIYGTPWSGKTSCYRNKRASLHTLFLMEQAKKNEITSLPPMAAFCKLLSSCSMMPKERATLNCILKTLGKIAEKIKVCELKNRPEKAAAELAHLNSLGKG